MYLATTCSDARWKGHDWLADNWRTYYKAPLLTWDNAWFNGPCLSWRVKPGTPVRITGAGVGDALLVDETKDAATPYEGSRYLRKIFRDSRLVATVGGTSHAVSPSGNPGVAQAHAGTADRVVRSVVVDANAGHGSEPWQRGCRPTAGQPPGAGGQPLREVVAGLCPICPISTISSPGSVLHRKVDR
jgi:hypothetical protein